MKIIIFQLYRKWINIKYECIRWWIWTTFEWIERYSIIVETAVLWITPCNYLDPSINEVSWPSWIHVWPSSFVLSAFTQPINTTFCFPLLTRSSTTICPRISSVSGLATTLWSAHFGGSAYSFLRTPIHNKLAIKQVNPLAIQILNIHFSLDNEQSLEIWDKL